jgi:hypothetical protein
MFQVRTVFRSEPDEVSRQESNGLEWSQDTEFDRFDLAVAAAWKTYKQLLRIAEEDVTVTVDVIDSNTKTVVWERTATRWPISLNQATQKTIEPIRDSQTHRHSNRDSKRHGPQANDWIGLGFLTAFTDAFRLEKHSGSSESKKHHLATGERSKERITR